MRFALNFAVGTMLTGLALGAGSANAAVPMPQPGVIAADAASQVMHRRHHHGYGRTTKAERMMRRQNTMRHGNPNARNPERPGYQQQLGNTTNGPRY